MKFDYGLTRHGKRAANEKWHKWFAWYPVRVGTRNGIWLEYIGRKERCRYGCRFWAYRVIREEAK